MEKKWERGKLGKTNLFVTPLCWGCAPLGNMPKEFGYEVPEKQAAEVLFNIFEKQINFLDTASVYGDSELRIGEALRERGELPEGFIIATKADRNKETNDFSAGQIRKSVQGSCKRLGLKQLQLVYLHDPEYHPNYKKNKNKTLEEILAENGPVAELEKMKKEGIILNIGISGGPIDMLQTFIKTGRFDVVITHNRWNLLWQVADSLIKEANKIGIGVVNAAPYAAGILASGPKENSRAVYQIPSKEIIERVKNIAIICGEYNVPLAAAALQFSLRDHRINSTVVGVSSPEQINKNLELAKLPIPDELWQKLEPFAIRDGDPEITR
ncbi:MAG: aldo/keto reductase [Patescibacteria group bacterium]